MADARIAVATPFVRKEDAGTASSWKDIYRSYRIILLRNYFRMRNSIQNGMWPTSSNYLIIACGVSIYLLEFRPPQLEALSTFLCTTSEMIPLPEGTPLWLYHIAFSAGVSITFFLILMKLRQYTLRMLLSYRDWMYETPKKQSYTTILWALLVRFVSGYQPSLYSFQNSLPRMNVPPLHETMEKLLESLEPLCSEEEMAIYRKGAANFQNTIGNRVQRLLYLKAWLAPNYVSDWWEKYAYLRSRLPLAINSNYYAFDHYCWLPTKSQTSRAANLLHSILSMKRQIDREELRPLAIRNTIPVCMAQYERLFSTIRMPGVEMDELVHYETPHSRHVVVWCRGILYCMTMYDSANQLLCPGTLEKVFQEIKEDADVQLERENEDDVVKHVSALSGLPRPQWAALQKRYFAHGINAESLDIIKRAICMVVLYNKVPTDICEKGKMLLHGNGSSVWFDKCFTLCIFPDGQCGMNVEHTMADAPVIGHIWEYAMTMEVIEKRYLDSGQVMPPPKSFKQRKFPPPFKLCWNVSKQLEPEVRRAVAFTIKNGEDLELVLFNHTNFGKGFIKSAKISPDAFIQIALQLAYYRDSGSFCQTYEAAATRLYQHGRTETVRSCTKESCAFVRAITEGDKSSEELKVMLHRASEKHRTLYVGASSGKGIDRHIFALYVVSKGLGYDNKFLEDVISRPWTLSTSQQPQQQIQIDMPDINLEAFRKMVSPGGGFGPVSDEGYGVSYMLPTEYNIFFHVSSKKSSLNTSSKRFVELINKSMSDMKDLFQD